MRAVITSLMLATGVLFFGFTGEADARGGYAAWLKHGDTYRVSGDFAGYKGALHVSVMWRGNRFVVHTPLGIFPLTRAGGAVTFRVKFEQAWASITWAYNRAYVIWKGQRGVASVVKIGSGTVAKDRGNKIR